MQFLNNVKRKSVYMGIYLGIATLLLRFIFSLFPGVTETIYSRFLFPIIRYILDYTIGWCPFPFTYLLIFGLVVYLIYRINGFFKMQPEERSIIQVLMSILSGIGYVIFLFMFLWGFNYARVSMEKQIGISSSQMTKASLKEELEISTSELIEARNKLNIDGGKIRWEDHPSNLEVRLRELVSNKMKALGYPIPGRVRGRILKPKGILLRISTAGVYNPFSGECNIDQGLHPLQVPFTWAHEFTHGYGITSEAACNFIAYIACKESEDPLINYAGHLGYWRYVASNYKSGEREKYALFRQNLPTEITKDLQSIYENGDQYPDILPEIRDFIYGSFLKSQGISDGLQNYSKVVRMNVAWRKKMDSKK